MSFNLINRYFFVLLLSLSAFTAHADSDVISKHIDPVESKALIESHQADTNFIIMDVRTLEEFNNAHIDGAIQIDFYDKGFANNLATLEKDKTYLVYCRSGRRSGIALDLMKKMGFKHAYNMKGGINQWNAANYPVIKR